MNGQHSAEQAGQGGQESHLSFLLNAANGQNALLGYPGAAGAGVIAGAPGLRYGGADASLEEQILQRASALRAEALMQQQQQQHQQRQHQLSAALAAFQQQQLSSLSLNPNIAALMEARGAQEQEALLGRTEALRELGIGGAAANAAAAAGAAGGLQVGANGSIERLQQLELGRLEELERRRQQLAALANLSGGARPSEIPQSGEKLVQDAAKTEPPPDKETHRDSNASAEKSKDDLRKTPGTVIVPCRARGMPMDHNFKTAYFVISEDAKHGEDLVCSYFACRNGGVKFRYCAHCMAPVAKRNFCRRHDHGMSAKSGEGENQDEEDENSMDQSESTAHKDEPEESVQKHEKPPVVEQPPVVEPPKPPEQKVEPDKQMTSSSLDVLSKAATSSFLMQSGQVKRKKPSEDVEKISEDVQDDPSEQPVDAPDLSSISHKRRSMWSALLIKRPRTKDPRHLSSWLNEVLTVSDFEAPLEFPDSSEPAPVSSDTSGEKNVLNSDRVKSSRENGERSSKGSHGGSKEKKNGEKEKKKRKLDPKYADESLTSVHVKSKKEEKSSKKSSEKKHMSGIDKKAFKKSASKDSPSKKDTDDGFVGSFADWRDRKKEKALKKSGGSLRK